MYVLRYFFSSAESFSLKGTEEIALSYEIYFPHYIHLSASILSSLTAGKVYIYPTRKTPKTLSEVLDLNLIDSTLAELPLLNYYP